MVLILHFKLIFIAFSMILLFKVSLGQSPEEVFHGCMEETGVPTEIIHKIINHDSGFDDQRGKCFEKCICIGLGLCDANDGKLIPEMFIKMKPYLSADKLSEELPKCNEINGTDICDSIHQRYICFYERIPKP
uniref:CSON014538 protein n=1 Tax=Culicoides sonorensis TaxID=179676 RepID=A0A336KSM2_CULSO